MSQIRVDIVVEQIERACLFQVLVERVKEMPIEKRFVIEVKLALKQPHDVVRFKQSQTIPHRVGKKVGQTSDRSWC